MNATFIPQGDVIDHIPTSDLEAGSVVVQGDLIGINTHSIPAGHLGAIRVAGVFDFRCEIWGHIKVGTKVYWSAHQGSVSLSDADGPYIGKSVRHYSEGDMAIRVRLSQ